MKEKTASQFLRKKELGVRYVKTTGGNIGHSYLCDLMEEYAQSKSVTVSEEEIKKFISNENIPILHPDESLLVNMSDIVKLIQKALSTLQPKAVSDEAIKEFIGEYDSTVLHIIESGVNEIRINDLMCRVVNKALQTFQQVEGKEGFSLEDMYMLSHSVVDQMSANLGNSDWKMKTTPKMMVDAFIKTLPEQPQQVEPKEKQRELLVDFLEWMYDSSEDKVISDKGNELMVDTFLEQVK